MQSRPKVVIVGGGVSGLATAHYIHGRLGDHVRLTLVEGGAQLVVDRARRVVVGATFVGPEAETSRSNCSESITSLNLP